MQSGLAAGRESRDCSLGAQQKAKIMQCMTYCSTEIVLLSSPSKVNPTRALMQVSTIDSQTRCSGPFLVLFMIDPFRH